MKPILCTKHYKAPVSKTFAVFTDVKNFATNIPAITHAEVVAGGEEFGVGTAWKETRVMFGKEATERLEITQCEKNKHYVVEAHSCGCHYKTRFDFTEKDGGTEVTMSFHGDGETLMAKVMGAVMAPLMKGTMRRLLEQDMESVRTAIEG